jgi:hypothetical protein
MPGKKAGLPFQTITLPPEIGNKASTVEQLSNECHKMQRDNAELQAKIASYEQDSIKVIEQYRAEIDERSSKTHEVYHQIEGLYEDKRLTIEKMRAENEKAKERVYQEDALICKEIEIMSAQLEVIRKFEEEREAIANDIASKEQSIEDEKRSHEAEKERLKKTTHDLLERTAKLCEDTLEREKEEYYDHLLRTTDQAILLHIQRRNNYENDLLSLREMYQDYTEKIQARREGNSKLRETIEQLKSGELINRSADQRKTISDLRQDLAASRDQLKLLQTKSKKDRETRDKERADEVTRMELSLKLQQDQLDHKLQQIAGLRDLTLRVLCFRSQLEAEFITVLGEVIYEVSQRENPGQTSLQSVATRKLSMTATEDQRGAAAFRQNTFSISHVLAQFTIEDRYRVVQRFMDRVHGELAEHDQQQAEQAENTENLP